MIFVREASAAVVLVTFTLSLQMRWDGRADFLGKNQFDTRRSQVRADPLCCCSWCD